MSHTIIEMDTMQAIIRMAREISKIRELLDERLPAMKQAELRSIIAEAYNLAGDGETNSAIRNALEKGLK